MGSCLTAESRSTSSPPSGINIKKRNNPKKRSSSFDHYCREEPLLHRIPGRLFLNGSNAIASLFSQQGQKGINQDAMIVWENFCSRSDTVFCGVFDGHGTLGHMVAKRVRDHLPLKLSANWGLNTTSEDVLREISLNTTGTINSVDTHFLSADEESEKQSDIFQTMKDSFLKAFKVMDRELRMQTSIDCFCSGTTAVTLIKQGQHLIIGNVGDSRAVLGTRDKDGSLIAVQLTVDLKPNVPAEAERIHKCRGRVFALRDEPEVARVWLPNCDFPGLAMARAFGDFCLKDFGLISVPDISCRCLSEKDEFIVLATDGIWDVLSNKEVVDIVASAPTRSSAARALVESAVRSWKYKHPTSKVDDCAVVCLFLDSSNTTSKDQLTSMDQTKNNADDPASLGLSGTVRTEKGRVDDYLKQDKAQPELAGIDWSGLEGVSRVDTLLKLPRFVPGKEDKKVAAEAQAAWK